MILGCKYVWQYISSYLDNNLTAEIRGQVEGHMNRCEACSAGLASTRNIISLTSDDRVFDLPAGFSERLHARLVREIDSGSGPMRPT